MDTNCGVVTPQPNDNSNRIANTAFVQKAIRGSYVPITSPITLTEDNYTVHIVAGGFAQGVPKTLVGTSFEFVNTDTIGSVTIVPFGGTINNAASVILTPGHSVTIKSTGLSTGITYIITSQY